MTLRRSPRALCCVFACTLALAVPLRTSPAADQPATDQFTAGFGKSDITPPPGLPMWGYGARHDALSEGALDTLWTKAVVIRAGDSKLALVGSQHGISRCQRLKHGVVHVYARAIHRRNHVLRRARRRGY